MSRFDSMFGLVYCQNQIAISGLVLTILVTQKVITLKHICLFIVMPVQKSNKSYSAMLKSTFSKSR